MKLVNIMFYQYGTSDGYAKISQVDLDFDLKYAFFSFMEMMENSPESRTFWKIFNQIISDHGEYPLGADKKPDKQKGKKLNLSHPEIMELFQKETELEVERMSISVSDLEGVTSEEMKQMSWIFDFLPPKKKSKKTEEKTDS